MSLPRIRLVVGRSRVIRIDGPGIRGFNFSDYDDVRLVCTGLDLELTKGDGDIEVVLDGKSIDVTVDDGAIDDAVAGQYDYIVDVQSDGEWFPVVGTPEKLIVSGAP